MFFKFLSHQIKEFLRGRNKTKDIVTRIAVMFSMLYVLSMAIGLGYFMIDLIEAVFSDHEPFYFFYGFILYYFMIYFLVRIALQALPTLSMKPYLTLNVRKSAIINFLNIKTLFSFFNIVQVSVLDEPFASLDPTTQIRLKKIIREIKSRDVTMLVSSHNLTHVTYV